MNNTSLGFYHPNPKGTGSAIKFSLHPAVGEIEGVITVEIAPQMSVGDRRGPNPTFPRFDWENKIVVKLGFNDLCKMLQVFRGEVESIDDGRGLFHRTARAATKVCLRHVVDPVCGYWFDVWQQPNDGAEARCQMLLTPAESLGLCECIGHALPLVAFGVPQTVAPGVAEVSELIERA